MSATFIPLKCSCPVCHGEGKKCDYDAAHDTYHCHGAHGDYDCAPGFRFVGLSSIGFRKFKPDDGRARPSAPYPYRLVNEGPAPQPKPSRKVVSGREILYGEKPPQPPSFWERLSKGLDWVDVELSSRNDEAGAVAFFTGQLGLPASACWSMDWQVAPALSGFCWTVPEWGLVNGEVAIVARHARFPRGADGKAKKLSKGNPDLPEGTPKRGVFIPNNWWEGTGPVLCPEGVSDTTAMKTCGLRVIGRPNNGPGGMDTIVHLYRERGEPGGDLVILIENDQKPDGRWAAKEGGLEAAQAGANRLGKVVTVLAPPAGFKDFLDWYVAKRGNDKDLPDPSKARSGREKLRLQEALEEARSNRPSDARLGELFLETMQYVATVHPQPAEERKPIRQPAPVPCHGGDGAEESATCTSTDRPLTEADLDAMFPPASLETLGESIERDRAEKEERRRKAEEQLAGAAEAYRLREWDTPEFPCLRPRCVGLEKVSTWDPAELRKRCKGCCNCVRNKIELEFRLRRAQIAKAVADELLVSEGFVRKHSWDAFRKRFSDSDAPVKHYQRFEIPGEDGYHVFVAGPVLGGCVPYSTRFASPEDMLASYEREVRPYLEEAASQRGQYLSTASEGWTKKRTQEEVPKGYRFVTTCIEPVAPEEMARILDKTDAVEVRGQGDGEDIIDFRRYKRRGGWTAEARDEFWRLRMFGSHMAEADFSFTTDAGGQAEPVLCGPPPGPPDDWLTAGPVSPDVWD